VPNLLRYIVPTLLSKEDRDIRLVDVDLYDASSYSIRPLVPCFVQDDEQDRNTRTAMEVKKKEREKGI
jgi:hypothetical protein